MAGGRGSRGRSRPRARAQAAVAPLERTRPGDRLEPAALLPSGRSVLVGLLLLLAALGAYGVARSTSAFAVTSVEVDGAPAAVAADVRSALGVALGTSLLSVDLGALEARAEALPWVAAASLDRAFPNTLHVTIEAERPAAVLRRGASSWLAAASGRVLQPLDRGARPALPRLWLKRDVEVEVGRSVGGTSRDAVRAVAPLVAAPLPGRVASVRASEEELTLVLRSGLEVRLGDVTELALKLEIARRILPALHGARYLDVSVPKHPVAAGTLDSQVEVETLPSTTP